MSIMNNMKGMPDPWIEPATSRLADERLTSYDTPPRAQSFNIQNTNLLIRTDNITSLSYINKQGETRSLSLITLAIDLWKYRLKHQIHLTAQHIPGVEKNIADRELRKLFYKNQWRMHTTAFQTLQQQFGFHDVDLFADRFTHLLPKYVSWKPAPGALTHDAFSLDGSQFHNPRINPP